MTDKAVSQSFAQALERANSALEAIGDYAHDKSAGPAVWDPLWEVRRMAYEGVQEALSIANSAPAIDAAREQDRARAAAPQAAVGVTLASPITEQMHVAAVKVLHRASGLDGLPQRMLDAMVAASPATKPEAPALFRALLTAERDASIDVSGDIARQEAQIDLADHLLVKFNELFPEAPNVRA